MLADLLLLLAAAAPAPIPGWKPLVLPDSQQLRQLWAVIPPTMRGGGWGYVRCPVAADGRLHDCKLLEESPAGAGFGPLALKVAGTLRQPAAAGNELLMALAFSVDANGEPSVRNPKIENPDWLKKPTSDDLRGVWPPEAWRRGLGGEATISCDITVNGHLSNCKVEKETPEGSGFGQAALTLMPQFLLKLMTVDGVPSRSEVRIPIRFPAFTPDDSITYTPRTTRVVRPTIAWDQAPTVAEVRAAFPAKLKSAATVGNATLQCRLNARGELTNCDTLVDNPSGVGSGQAARALAKLFRTPPRLDDGSPVTSAMMSIPFTFNPDILDPAKPFAGKLKYAKLPTAQELTAAYGSLSGPPRTLRAVLACDVQQKGVLANCSVDSETPAGSGFGQRALALAPAFRVTTWTEDGLPTVGARIKVPMRYDVPEAAKP